MVTLRMRPKPVNSTREHLAVVEAIRRGDALAARELHRAHRERGSRELTEILQRHRLMQV
jgi:DNA-binding GntR family transcriptional regulator